MADETPERIGPYTILGELGQGGMGVVYRAHDPQLGRDIALKVLPSSAARDLRARFVREGKVAARLSHPHIVSVLAAGEDDGMAWLAQDLIEGRSLSDVLDDEDIAPGEAARLVHLVALALAHAHEHGVIHRDIKPANILVDASNAPYVADFGLARDVEGSAQLSKSGQVLGTPHYMSPEQASGSVGLLDGRTDIWACGVVLYECISNALPFAGESAVDVLSRVVREEPRPLRSAAPYVPRDLAVIVSKCLEKNRDRRYATAADLADDLGRFLEGEAIRAKPPSPLNRLTRFVARRKLAAMVAVVGVLAVGGVAALLVPQWLAASERADSATKAAADAEAEAAAAAAQAEDDRATAMERLRGITDMALDAALSLRRAGDRVGMRRFADRVEQVCREAIEQLPESPEPHYRLGRMYRALLKDDDAREEQALALRKDPAYGPALYEVVVLDAQRYRRLMAGLESASRLLLARRRAAGQPTRTAPMTRAELLKLDDDTRSVWEALRAAVARLTAKAHGLSSGQVVCAQGFQAWVNNDTGAAREAFESAVEAEPDLEEAYAALARLAAHAGDHALALEWWSKGVARDRGFVPHLLGRASTHQSMGMAASNRGDDPDAAYAAAITDYEAALQADPRNADGWFELGGVRVNRTRADLLRGGAALAGYEQALADFGRALKLAPRHARAWLYRGHAYVNLGRTKRDRGQGGDEEVAAAIRDYSTAIEIAPHRAETWTGRGHAHAHAAMSLMNRGKECVESYRRAEADFDHALECDPDDAGAWMGRGLARANWGIWLDRTGRDATERYKSAVKDYTQALRRVPGRGVYWQRRADAWSNIALATSRRGGIAEGEFLAAIHDYGEAITRNPGLIAAWTGRALTHYNHGLDAERNRRSPLTHYAATDADCSAAIERNPRNAVAWMYRALARGARAQVLSRQDADSADVFESAIADFVEATRLNPGDAVGWRQCADTRTNYAVHQRRWARDATEQFAKSLEALAISAQINPTSLATVRFRAVTHYNRAVWLASLHRDGKADFDAARKDFEYALTRDASLEAKYRPLIERCLTGK